MSSFILILSSISLSLIVAHLIFKKFNIIRSIDKKNKFDIFVSDEDSLKYILNKVNLNDREKATLEVLNNLVSLSNLYQGFEDAELLKKWLINTRRVIANSEQFDQVSKEELEYDVYEIYRKINNKRILLHPSIKKISDISIRQNMEISSSKSIVLKGEFLDSNFHSCSINIVDYNYKSLKSLKLEQKNISITFWKTMDGCYQFHSKVLRIEKNQDNVILHCEIPKAIECIQIRSFPRQNVEIPIKFRQEIFEISANSETLQETFGGHIFGIVNNLGPKGCSIISHLPIPENTSLQIEIPVFDQLLHLKGKICSVAHHSEVYTLHIEFSSETHTHNTLLLYKYIFAEDSSDKK